MRLIACIIFSVLATLASVLALPIHLANSDTLASRDPETANLLHTRGAIVTSDIIKRSTYYDEAALVLRQLIISELRERYMDAGVDGMSTHSKQHYPTVSQTSKKHHLNRGALRRMRWYARRRRTQRKLRQEDLEDKHQEVITPHLLARATPPSAATEATVTPGVPAAPSPQHKVLKLWKNRIHCRVLNGTTECFKTSRVKPNHVTELDAKGAKPLRSE